MWQLFVLKLIFNFVIIWKQKFFSSLLHLYFISTNFIVFGMHSLIIFNMMLKIKIVIILGNISNRHFISTSSYAGCTLFINPTRLYCCVFYTYVVLLQVLFSSILQHVECHIGKTQLGIEWYFIPITLRPVLMSKSEASSNIWSFYSQLFAELPWESRLKL